MHPIQDLFLESFSYVLQFDMHFYMHSYVDKKFYSCKNWVLQKVNYKKKEGDFTGLCVMIKGGSSRNNSDSDSNCDVSDDLTYDGLSSKV
jgi:hypothetical protein